MGEFWRYRELLKRNTLKEALRSERESLLSAYEDLIGNEPFNTCDVQQKIST